MYVSDMKENLTLCPGDEIILLSSNQWEEVCREIGRDLPWTAPLAHVCISGFFPNLDIKEIVIGGKLVLSVEGAATVGDHLTEDVTEALQKNFRAGLRCRIVQTGELKTRSEVFLY